MTKSFLNRNRPRYGKLERFGFSFERGGAHASRTMMLGELSALLKYVKCPDAPNEQYLKAIEEENCLGKRTGKTRKLTYRHLADLYSLDPSSAIFRSLLFFWRRDTRGQPLLALLCAYSRDPILRSSAPFLLNIPEGAIASREAMKELIDNIEPGRFSEVTLNSVSKNINSTWTQSGHLVGRVRKIRSRATPTAGAISLALFLGYLTGIRGDALFGTEYTRILDCSLEHSLDLAEEASRKGWIILKRVANVIEVLFPRLLGEKEMEWTREQG